MTKHISSWLKWSQSEEVASSQISHLSPYSQLALSFMIMIQIIVNQKCQMQPRFFLRYAVESMRKGKICWEKETNTFPPTDIPALNTQCGKNVGWSVNIQFTLSYLQLRPVNYTILNPGTISLYPNLCWCPRYPDYPICNLKWICLSLIFGMISINYFSIFSWFHLK